MQVTLFKDDSHRNQKISLIFLIILKKTRTFEAIVEKHINTYNIMRVFLVFFSLLFSLSAFSQKEIRFSYDALGNRVKRVIVLQQSETNQRSMSQPEDKDFYSDMISEKQIRIWPNPTEGHLKVEIQGLGTEEKATLRITAMNGSVVVMKETSSAITELDLSRNTNGIYLLYISVNGQETTWKIIKK